MKSEVMAWVRNTTLKSTGSSRRLPTRRRSRKRSDPTTASSARAMANVDGKGSTSPKERKLKNPLQFQGEGPHRNRTNSSEYNGIHPAGETSATSGRKALRKSR